MPQSISMAGGSMQRNLCAAVLTMTLFSLVGCATLSKSECTEGDWRTIGYNDGQSGSEAGSRLAKHAKACDKHGVAPDRTLYQAGYAEGIKQFCSPGNGYNIGKSGDDYSGVCPVELQSAFLVRYVEGLKENLAGLESEEDRLRDRLEDRREIYDELVDDEVTGDALDSAKKKVEEIKSELATNRRSQKNIEDRISSWSGRT